MNIKIELLGYKGKLTHITSQLAYPPWHKEDRLLVHVSFDEPYPASIISTAIAIPVKDYSTEEFLKVVKEYGESDLAVSMEKHRVEEEKHRREDNMKKDLKILAEGLEAKFSEKGGKK